MHSPLLPLLVLLPLFVGIASCVECSPLCTSLHQFPERLIDSTINVPELENLLKQFYRICLKDNTDEFIILQAKDGECEHAFTDMFEVLWEFSSRNVDLDSRGLAAANIATILDIHNRKNTLKTFVSFQQLAEVYAAAEDRIACLEVDAPDKILKNEKALAEFDAACFKANYFEMEIGSKQFDVAKPYNPLSAINFYLAILVKDIVPLLPERATETETRKIRTLLDNLMTVFYYLELGSLSIDAPVGDDEIVDFKNNFELSGSIDILVILDKALDTIVLRRETYRSLVTKVQFILYDQYKITQKVVSTPTEQQWETREWWHLNFNYYLNRRGV